MLARSKLSQALSALCISLKANRIRPGLLLGFLLCSLTGSNAFVLFVELLKELGRIPLGHGFPF
jgi:hypothetical protein